MILIPFILKCYYPECMQGTVHLVISDGWIHYLQPILMGHLERKSPGSLAIEHCYLTYLIKPNIKMGGFSFSCQTTKVTDHKLERHWGLFLFGLKKWISIEIFFFFHCKLNISELCTQKRGKVLRRNSEWGGFSA